MIHVAEIMRMMMWRLQ